MKAPEKIYLYPSDRAGEEYEADGEWHYKYKRMTQEEKDKCADCPFNDTSCPGGMYCTEED